MGLYENEMNKINVLEKYEVQESMTDRQSLIPWWKQEVVRDGRFLVTGAGAIGNEVLKNLALIGAGHILICDMDRIETSNLSRTVLFRKEDVGRYKAEVAAERVKEMSVCPDVEVDYFVGDIVHELGDGIFRQFDVVLGCLDNMDARLSVNKRCNLLKIPYVDGGISELRMSMQVSRYPESSCFACGVSASEIERERGKRHSCDNKRRKFVTEKKAATILISTAIVGALQVQEAVKILHDMDVEYGVKYYFDGYNNNFEKIKVRPKKNCMHHMTYENIQMTKWTNQVTLSEFLNWVSEQHEGKEYYIDILGKYKFTTTGKCISCGKEIEFNLPDFKLYAEDYYCEDCLKKGNLMHGWAESEDVTILSATDQKMRDMTLEELGIPHGDILRVACVDEPDRYEIYELSGDVSEVLHTIRIR